MSRPIFLSLLVFALLIAAILNLQGALLVPAIPLMLYLLYGMWSLPERLDIDVHRTLSADRVAPDDFVTVMVSVTNRGAAQTEALVEDVLPPSLFVRSGSPRQLLALPKGGATQFEYVISGWRGMYSLESVRVEVGDALGLAQRVEKIAVAGQLFVVPNISRLKNFAIRPRRTRVYAGNIPARAGGTGTEFHGVRQYQPGDSPRSINWHASVRHDAMFSNEYQQERVADVGIVLDGRKRSNLFIGGRSLFDYSVLAVAALSDAFLTQGNRVGMVVYGSYQNWTMPGYGKVQRERILQALMSAHVGESLVFADLQYLSPRLFPPESQIVLVSPLVSDDLDVLIQLRARGFQVLVICPDPVAFEMTGLESSPQARLAARIVRMERDLLMLRLRRAGVHVILWDVQQPFDQAVGPALSRQALALPTGSR